MIIGAPFVVYGTQCNFVILVSERRAELSYHMKKYRPKTELFAAAAWNKRGDLFQ